MDRVTREAVTCTNHRPATGLRTLRLGKGGVTRSTLALSGKSRAALPKKIGICPDLIEAYEATLRPRLNKALAIVTEILSVNVDDFLEANDWRSEARQIRARLHTGDHIDHIHVFENSGDQSSHNPQEDVGPTLPMHIDMGYVVIFFPPRIIEAGGSRRETPKVWKEEARGQLIVQIRNGSLLALDTTDADVVVFLGQALHSSPDSSEQNALRELFHPVPHMLALDKYTLHPNVVYGSDACFYRAPTPRSKVCCRTERSTRNYSKPGMEKKGKTVQLL